jgi:hypothetical protein
MSSKKCNGYKTDEELLLTLEEVDIETISKLMKSRLKHELLGTVEINRVIKTTTKTVGDQTTTVEEVTEFHTHMKPPSNIYNYLFNNELDGNKNEDCDEVKKLQIEVVVKNPDDTDDSYDSYDYDD